MIDHFLWAATKKDQTSTKLTNNNEQMTKTGRPRFFRCRALGLALALALAAACSCSCERPRISVGQKGNHTLHSTGTCIKKGACLLPSGHVYCIHLNPTQQNWMPQKFMPGCNCDSIHGRNLTFGIRSL